MDKLIMVTTLITSLTTIFTFGKKVFNTVNKLDDKINLWEKTLEKNTLYILKLALFSEGLSVNDRIQAGQQYLKINHDYVIEKKS